MKTPVGSKRSVRPAGRSPRQTKTVTSCDNVCTSTSCTSKAPHSPTESEVYSGCEFSFQKNVKLETFSVAIYPDSLFLLSDNLFMRSLVSLLLLHEKLFQLILYIVLQ